MACASFQRGAADSPAVTPATGLFARASRLWPATQLQQAKPREEKKAAKAAAPWLPGDYRALGYVNPFTLNAQLKGWLEAGKAEVALKGLWHKAKPRGAYIQRVQDAGPTGTLPCFAHACFRVLHSLYSLCTPPCFAQFVQFVS